MVVAFARPEMTTELMDFLISRNLKVYLFIDKAQSKFPSNEKMMSASRKYHGHPNVFVNVASKAHGPQRGVEAALDWVFQTEQLVVVIEDDSIVNIDSIEFFDKAVGILSDRIVIISSRRILDEKENKECNKHSHLSRFALTNGWMTSREFWIGNYHRNKPLSGFMGIRINSLGFLLNWATKCFFFAGVYRYESGIGSVGWDQKVIYSLLRDNLYSFVPNRSAVGNRGMDEFASNTKSLDSQITTLYRVDFVEPNLEISENDSCQIVVNKAFLSLYGVSRKNLLSPIKCFFEKFRIDSLSQLKPN